MDNYPESEGFWGSFVLKNPVFFFTLQKEAYFYPLYILKAPFCS